MVIGVVPSPPPVLASNFVLRIGLQQSSTTARRFSSSVANSSRSRAPHRSLRQKRILRKAKVQPDERPHGLGDACYDRGEQLEKNVGCEYDRLNGSNSTLQACAKHLIFPFMVYMFFVNENYDRVVDGTKQFQTFYGTFSAWCFICFPHEGYRSVSALDVVGVNRTIFHNPCVLCTDTCKSRV